MSILYCFLYTLDYFRNFILWWPMFEIKKEKNKSEIRTYIKVLAFSKSSKHLCLYWVKKIR